MLLMTTTEKLLGAKKVHEHTGHKQSENMAKILKGSEVGEKKIIDEVIKRCKICQKSQKGQDVPKVSTFKPKTFNEIVTVDLKINIKKGSHILWMIDPFSRFARGVEVKSKTSTEVIQAIENEWFYVIGCPTTGIWGDNGTEFLNSDMEDLCRKWDITFRTGPPYSPWSNGINERNHHSCDIVVNRLLMEDPK